MGGSSPLLDWHVFVNAMIALMAGGATELLMEGVSWYPVYDATEYDDEDAAAAAAAAARAADAARLFGALKGNTTVTRLSLAGMWYNRNRARVGLQCGAGGHVNEAGAAAWADVFGANSTLSAVSLAGE
jgi:hypothetical protein